MTSDIAVQDIVAAVGVALIGTDLEGTVTVWNPAAEALYGWTAAEALGRDVLDLTPVPENRGASGSVFEQVLREGSWVGEHLVQRKDGSTFLAHVRLRTLLGPDGTVTGVLGTSGDVSELRVAQAERDDGEHRLRLALDAGELGTWEWDQATGLVTWDERLEGIFGYQPHTFPKTFDAWFATIHPDDRAAVLATVQQAMDNRSRHTIEHRVVRPDGSLRWIEGRGQVLLGQDDEVRGTTGCVRDVTEAKRSEAERERMDASERLLATAGEQLAQSLDVADVLATTAALTVPALADLIVVHLVDTSSGALEQVLLRHARPEAELAFGRLTELYPIDADSTVGPGYVVRTGAPQLIADVTDELLQQMARTAEHLSQLRDLGVSAVASVPLTARGHTIGALTLVRHAQLPFSMTQLGTVSELARRVAMALDNSRAYLRERTAALTLQRSLLPHVAAVPGVEVHASYLPGAEGTEVGGDWYDVVRRPDGSTVLGIGDVMGRGITAAALMGQVSTAARAYALAGLGPADVLSRLHDIVVDRGEGQIVTCCYAVLSPDRRELVVASAGHLPPLLAPANGPGAYIDVPVPLGARLPGDRTLPGEIVVTLTEGTVLALFTDGLVEDRHQPLDAGMELARAATSTPSRDLSELSRRLLRSRDTTSHDDVAILLLRV